MSDAFAVGPADSAGGERRWSDVNLPPLLGFVVRRLAAAVVTLLVASVLVFLATSVIPGSPASAVLGREAKAAQVAAIEHQLGYDRPLVTRYVSWLGHAARGDFGQSAVAAAQGREHAPVWAIIKEPLLNSASLAGVAALILFPVSIVFGVLAGMYANRWQDHAISTLSLVAMSLPEFVIGAILVAIFFVGLDLLPPVSLLAPGQSPFADPQVLVLPVLTLVGASIAWTIRLVRVGAVEVLKTDYVRMARLNGFRERRVVSRYVLRNALAPSVQIFALTAQYLFGGVIVVEAVFQYPGIGNALVGAVGSHDNTQIQAIALILMGLYILINILADFVVVLLVPRLRTRR